LSSIVPDEISPMLKALRWKAAEMVNGDKVV